ncbi:MAG: hypothetical protein ACLFPL_03180 [Candidatus Nanoarchaeia archaeon]
MVTIVCIDDSIVEGEGDEKGQKGWVGRLSKDILKDSNVGEMLNCMNIILNQHERD